MIMPAITKIISSNSANSTKTALYEDQLEKTAINLAF